MTYVYKLLITALTIFFVVEDVSWMGIMALRRDH
jgi:hypothetical protein